MTGEVERCAEWSSQFDGTLADLQEAVEGLRAAGAPGSSEIGVSGGGIRWTLSARYYAPGDEDGDESDVPAEPVASGGAQ